MIHAGGCMCGAVRYETEGPPVRVTVCHCRWCQVATGAGFMIEPIFRLECFRVTKGTLALYHHRSAGSGKMIGVHFCAACDTKIRLTFERFPEICGVYVGTFDDPDWIEIRPDNAKQIFIGTARPDAILMPHLPAYERHAITNDGVPEEHVVFDAPHPVGRRG